MNENNLATNVKIKLSVGLVTEATSGKKVERFKKFHPDQKRFIKYLKAQNQEFSTNVIAVACSEDEVGECLSLGATVAGG